MSTMATLQRPGPSPAGMAGIESNSGKSSQSVKPESDLDFHCLGFVVRVQGDCTKSALAQFRHFLTARGCFPTDEELSDSIERSRKTYLHAKNHLFVCVAQPCCSALDFDTSEVALAKLAQKAGFPISKTGCQGQCKYAPIMSFRAGDQSQMLARVMTGEDLRAALVFSRACARAGSLLVNPGDAEPLLHDPAHHHHGPDACLQPLRFLLGHFRGKGRVAQSGYTFDKEVIGTLEAGGRFIGLRMSASYPRTDGVKDTHKALVIIGSNRSGSFVGKAFTDGGITREYTVEQRGGFLQFEDVPPDHSRRWKRARKILEPTSNGFEERLEADAGEGFTTYYAIAMDKITPERRARQSRQAL